jgi:hypothetical protein
LTVRAGVSERGMEKEAGSMEEDARAARGIIPVTI